MFDWLQFLDQNGITYEKQGKHARIPCPFCAVPTARRMSVDLTGKGWWCWVGRKEHSGINPTRLVAALLKCSMEQAAMITGSRGVASASEFDAKIAALRSATTDRAEVEAPQWLKEFRPIDDSPTARPFVRYLERRGFEHGTIMNMTESYGLHYALHGLWRYRIIFPVYLDGKLVAWSGRTIDRNQPFRYRAEGQAPHYLLWFDELRCGGDHIILAEGPFDSLKLRTLGSPSTCFFTSGPSPEQINLLYDLLPRYKRRILMLDRGTLFTSLQTQAALSSLRVEVCFLPENVKDPGTISSREELRSILTQAIRRA